MRGIDESNNMFKKFEKRYSQVARQVVDWYRCGPSEIIAILLDGSKVVYNELTNVVCALPSVNVDVDESDWRRDFSKRLNSKLMEKRMTISDLASLTGLSRASVYKYVDCNSTPSAYNMIKIADALECSVNELIGLNFKDYSGV